MLLAANETTLESELTYNLIEELTAEADGRTYKASKPVFIGAKSPYAIPAVKLLHSFIIVQVSYALSKFYFVLFAILSKCLEVPLFLSEAFLVPNCFNFGDIYKRFEFASFTAFTNILIFNLFILYII